MSHYRILVTGSEGQLGSEIKLLANSIIPDGIFFFTDYKELDITDKGALEDFIGNNKINAIVNCAAFTAVDKAEIEKEKAELVNAMAPKYLAEIAKDFNCKLVHISTDYVFDGTNHKPYGINDVPNPQSVYGKTKLNGENAIVKVSPDNTLIIRTAWVFSSFGKNFVKTMLSLGQERDSLSIVSDQIGSPTYAKDLAQVILNLISELSNNEPELLHYSNEGVCSWYDFAYEIFNQTNLNVTLHAISSDQYQTEAKRPFYSLLSKKTIKDKYNIIVPHWKESLKDCLKEIAFKDLG